MLMNSMIEDNYERMDYNGYMYKNGRSDHVSRILTLTR